jgi:hypothetical protein
MYRALGLAGRAGGEGDQADIVTGGIAGREILVAGLRHQGFEFATCAAEGDDSGKLRRMGLGALQIGGEAVVAKRQRDPGLAQGIGELACPQHRHGRDRDAAGLDHGEIGRDHHRRVAGAQQHAIAADHAEIAGQHIGDAVHRLGEIGVAPAQIIGDHGDAPATPFGDVRVEEFDDAVQSLRIGKPRLCHPQIGPAFARRQVVPRETVLMPRSRKPGCCHLVPLQEPDPIRPTRPDRRIRL